jgi:hypothetical protein
MDDLDLVPTELTQEEKEERKQMLEEALQAARNGPRSDAFV